MKMVGSVVEGATPRHTIDASPTSTDASTLLWSRIIIFRVSQNWKNKNKQKEQVRKMRFKQEKFCLQSWLWGQRGAAAALARREELGWHRITPSITPGTACGSGYNL